MSNSKIDLDFMARQAFNDDPADIADHDLEGAADWVFVTLDEKVFERTTSHNDMKNTMRKYPQLVAAHAIAHAISRLELSYRTLKIEELRLLGSISDYLKAIASASKGGSNE